MDKNGFVISNNCFQISKQAMLIHFFYLITSKYSFAYVFSDQLISLLFFTVLYKYHFIIFQYLIQNEQYFHSAEFRHNEQYSTKRVTIKLKYDLLMTKVETMNSTLYKVADRIQICYMRTTAHTPTFKRVTFHRRDWNEHIKPTPAPNVFVQSPSTLCVQKRSLSTEWLSKNCSVFNDHQYTNAVFIVYGYITMNVHNFWCSFNE